MANKSDYTLKSDQPRVSAAEVKRTEAAPSMQYRVTGIKSFNPRQARKTGRMGERQEYIMYKKMKRGRKTRR